MDSIHPPSEVQFVVVHGNGRSRDRPDHRRHHPDDGGDNNGGDEYDGAYYLSDDDDDRSSLGSPPNSPLRLSPCSVNDNKNENENDDDEEDDDDDDEEQRRRRKDFWANKGRSVPGGGGESRSSRPDLLPSARGAGGAPEGTLPLSSSRFARVYDSDDYEDLVGTREAGIRTMSRSFSALPRTSTAAAAAAPRSSAPHLGSSLSALDRVVKPPSANAFRGGASHGNGSSDGTRGARQEALQESTLRDSKGSSIALPFEDEEGDGPWAGSAGAPARPPSSSSSQLAFHGSARALPTTIDEFPSLDEDDDDEHWNGAAAAMASRFEIPAAPTDEGPVRPTNSGGLLRTAGALDRSEKAADRRPTSPYDRDRPPSERSKLSSAAIPTGGDDGGPPSAVPPQANPAPPAANSWMSFNLLRQRVIEAVSPLPPVSTMVIEPKDGRNGNEIPAWDTAAGGDEPPSLSLSRPAAPQARVNTSLDETSMHPLDERDELQQSSVSRGPRQPSLRPQGADPGRWRQQHSDSHSGALGRVAPTEKQPRTSLPNGGLSATPEFVPKDSVTRSLASSPKPDVALVTPPHPAHHSVETADRRPISSALVLRSAGHSARDATSRVVISPPATRSPTVANSELMKNSSGTASVDASRRDSFGDEVKCDKGSAGGGGWWVEEELAKRQHRRAGDKKQFSVAERIAALNFKIDSPPSSQPSSPDRPVEAKRLSISGSSRDQRPETSKLEPPGSNIPSDSFFTPDKVSIVGVFSPPAMKRINDSQETFAHVDQSIGSVSSRSRNIESFHDAQSDPYADATDPPEFFHDPEPETTPSLIGAIESMVRGIEACTSRNARATTSTGQFMAPPDTPLTKQPQITPIPGTHVGTRSLPESSASARSQSEPNEGNKGSLSLAATNSGHADSLLLEGVKPAFVKPLDSEIGIPKGDVMVSLLGTDSTWSSNVNEAIWRCRTMRHNCDSKWQQERADRKSTSPKPRLTLSPGSFDGNPSIESAQIDAIDHLKFDELGDALFLYEGILRRYDDWYTQECEQTATRSRHHDVSKFKLVVGQAIHNIGVIKLLQGDHESALTFFERACLNRTSCGRLGDPDHTSSLVKLALCHFALENFTSAQAELEEALEHLRKKKPSMAEYRQHAEVLNNLGCLCYLRGHLETAVAYFEESLDLQSRIAEQSLYVGSRFSCHNGTLNSTITKGNLGLLALATGDPSMSITAFEASLRDQQLLLRDAQATLLSTFEYLAIANQITGNREKAVQLLRRMLHIQIDAYGPDDDRCLATGEKISNVLHDTGNGKPSHPNSLARDAHAVQQNAKFRPLSMIRRRHSKIS